MKKLFTNPWVITGMVVSAVLIAWYFLSGKKYEYSEWALMRYVSNDKNFGSNNHLPAGHRLWDSVGFNLAEEPNFKSGDRVTVVPTGGTAIQTTVLDVFQEPRSFKPQGRWWVATGIRTEQVTGTKGGTITKRV